MLKQIEIYGFKSFAEKTILNFNDEINGIVGPNGSGKSNIVDAIKWCLGEQSLKEIRAKNPLDVIFNGSESKPASNWSEVTLVLDNSKGIFPIDYQEISITRRIYRNGETEYYINRTPCRLKDIKELILDTGLSSDGYAIIPQGKVEFVVSAKPEERRLLFEETAGIAKYKLKREETLRKLERVKLDMARVEDILAYLKEQMAALEQAVKKAKNYQKYKQELQMLECANVIIQVENIEQQLNANYQVYNEKTTKYTELASMIANEEANIAEIKLQILELEKEFLRLKDVNADVDKGISITSQKIENFRNELKNIDTNIEKLRKEIEELNIRNENYHKEIADLEEKRETILNTLEEKEKNKSLHYEEYETYRREISEGQNVVKHKNNQLTELVYKRTKLRNDILELSRELQKLNLDKISIEKEIQTNNKNKEISEEELRKITEQITILENAKIEINEKLNQLLTQLQQYENSLKEKEYAYEDVNKEFYRITSLIENFSSNVPVGFYNFSELIKLLHDNNLSDLYVPVIDILKIKPEYVSVITSYLGNKLYWLVVNNEENARKIISVIKDAKLGYVTLIIKERLEQLLGLSVDSSILKLIDYEPQWDKVIKFLFSDITYVDDELRSAFIIHTGDKSTKEVSYDIIQLKNQVSYISENLKNLSNEIQFLTKQIEDLLSKKTSLEKELVSIDTELKSYYEVKKEKEEYINSIVELNIVLENNLRQTSNDIAQLQKKIEEINSEVKLLDEQEKQLRDEIDILVNKISQLQSNKVVEEYVMINSEYTRLQEQYRNIENEINSKYQLIQVNKNKVDTFSFEISELEKSKETIFVNIQEEEKKLENLLHQKNEVSQKLDSHIKLLEEKRNLLVLNEQKVKQLNEQKELLQQEINSIEIEKTTLINTKNNYINWLADKYSLSFDEAKQLYGNIKEVDLQTIEKLKKRIESMSNINLGAPEEYAQLEEKYNHLVTQQQDLIKSQQDLKEAITKINQQISDNFKETFVKVRENFIKLCNILFEGGKADLILTDEQNVLESGIEIFVQPPGKKLQNINLLSGGEKSLVAFALLFAFFMVKPSPVCILDEADAQLDETNVVRFMKLLKDFSQNTKFIMITHNTRTMEFIDTLYGVTMEELGVSKVIAIKLQPVSATV
ncbi:MAG: chromosome segregation protein SMC [Endomicrobia bacterium]|nr:chromosome segregation protein SMC [Endomicrobiia bacterium]